MFKQKKYLYELLESNEQKITEHISSAEDDISRYTEKLSTTSKDENPWDFNTYTEWLENAKCQRKAAEDLRKQLEKIFG